jgi:hypothetical protein
VTRSEAVAAVEALASELESDVRAAQTRDQHLRASRRVAEARRIAADLREPASTRS